MTGRSMADLGFRGSGITAAPDRTPAPAGDGRRQRDVLTDATVTAVSLLPLGTEPGTALGRIGAVEARAVDRAVATSTPTITTHGSAALRSGASQALHTAYQWLREGTYTERTGRRLRFHRQPGDRSGLAVPRLRPARRGPLPVRGGTGRRPDRRRSSTGGTAFGCLALLAKAAGRPREAIAAAQGAQSVVRTYGSPRMMALMAMREAVGWALMGDRSATDLAIVRAHHLYAKGPADADPGWLEFFSPGELAGLEALARADLGQHERAAAGAEQAVLLHGNHFARNRALYIGDVAIQHAVRDRPEPEAAAEAADRALAHLPTIRSDRLLQQLHNVSSALQRHAAVLAVANWLEKYQATTDVS